MTGTWALAALWLGLALIATLVSIWLRVATALSEIVVGTIAQLLIGALVGTAVLGGGPGGVKFPSGTRAIVLTFLARAELDPGDFRRYGGRPSEVEAKYLLLCLFGLGALAAWADSEPVLPAYLIGMVLAGTVGKDHALVRRLRTLTFGLLTPFYFIRAGSFVSVPALVAPPPAFIIFIMVKITSNMDCVSPVNQVFPSPDKEAMYTTL